jgi:hypothetical protein
MNDENLYGSGLPEEIEYTASKTKNEGPVGVTAPVLDDIDYAAPAAKKGGPTGVAAPVLDDMSSGYSYDSSKKGAPTGVTAPVLDDEQVYSSSPQTPKKLVLSDDDIIAGLTPELRQKFDALPADKQKQIIDMRRSQLGAEAPAAPVSAPVLDEDNYTPPPKKEEPPKPEVPVSKPVLDDEPEAPKYVRKYADEDLERAKADARKAAASSLAPDQKDSKESLRMMLELKEERRAELAGKGFKICIVLAIIGVIGAVFFHLLYSGGLGLPYKDGMSGFSSKIEGASLYIAVAAALSAVLLITGIPKCKSIASLIYLLFCLIQLFPGLMMLPQHEGSMAKAVLFYAVAFLCSVAVFISISASEAVGQYFKKDKNY